MGNEQCRMLTDAQLLELAGKAAFARGRAYCAEDRVQLSKHTAATLAGTARGTQHYEFSLKRQGERWRWSCACPAADDGSFCKHLVAAVLTARDTQADGAPARDDLFEFLRAQPAQRLAEWLKTLADDDRDVDARLRMYRAMADPAALKAALTKSLKCGAFLDYRASLHYATRLGTAIAALEQRLAEDPAHCRELCEYALGRLFVVIGRCDDSSGSIGERMHEIAHMHARACAAAHPGKALVKPLFALKCKDEWGMLPLADYWDALAGDGHAAYGRLIADELETLPQHPREADRYGETFAIRHRAEEYARADGDFALLQRVLRWDLRHAYDHLRVIESLREFGKEREALAFAEDAVKRFPDDVRLRRALALSLQTAGLGDEAMQQNWQAFVLESSADNWDALRVAAGKGWPEWRTRALGQIGEREKDDASIRITLLMHDGDLDAALTLAQSHKVWPHTLRELAERVERTAPHAAGELYLRLAEALSTRLDPRHYADLVSCLRHASRLLPQEQWQPALAAVRTHHLRKTKLMGMLAEVGL